MPTPLVSVIIPVWNRESTIIRAINSVIQSDYKNIEVIVSDNGSDDCTVDLVESAMRYDNRIVLLKSDVNMGPVANWLKCINHVSGEFVKVVWSDDEVESDTISRLIDPLLGNEDVSFSYCNARIVCAGGHVLTDNLYHMPDDRDVSFDDFVTGFALKIPHLPVSPGCALLRSKHIYYALDLINTYSGECKQKAIGPDVMLMYGALLLGKKGRYVSDTSVIFHSDDSSITNQSGRLVINSCYDHAVTYMLKNCNNKGVVDVFLVLRHLRSVIDFNRGRSVIGDDLRRSAYRALFSLSIFSTVRFVAVALLKRLFRYSNTA